MQFYVFSGSGAQKAAQIVPMFCIHIGKSTQISVWYSPVWPSVTEIIRMGNDVLVRLINVHSFTTCLLLTWQKEGKTSALAAIKLLFNELAVCFEAWGHNEITPLRGHNYSKIQDILIDRNQPSRPMHRWYFSPLYINFRLHLTGKTDVMMMCHFCRAVTKAGFAQVEL